MMYHDCLEANWDDTHWRTIKSDYCQAYLVLQGHLQLEAFQAPRCWDLPQKSDIGWRWTENHRKPIDESIYSNCSFFPDFPPMIFHQSHWQPQQPRSSPGLPNVSGCCTCRAKHLSSDPLGASARWADGPEVKLTAGCRVWTFSLEVASGMNGM